MAEAENIMVWQRQRLAEAEVKKPHNKISVHTNNRMQQNLGFNG